MMEYQNAKQVLPPDLIAAIQDYVQGKMIYIPRKEKVKTGWGEKSGTKEALRRRNQEIVRRRQAGDRIEDIASRFYLSQDSIRKIVGTKDQDMSRGRQLGTE